MQKLVQKEKIDSLVESRLTLKNGIVKFSNFETLSLNLKQHSDHREIPSRSKPGLREDNLSQDLIRKNINSNLSKALYRNSKNSPGGQRKTSIAANAKLSDVGNISPRVVGGTYLNQLNIDDYNSFKNSEFIANSIKEYSNRDRFSDFHYSVSMKSFRKASNSNLNQSGGVNRKSIHFK